jgi:CheY-like chemotaxis protein
MEMAKIFIVDDQESVRDLIRATLSNLPYELIVVNSADEAVRKAKQLLPELIIMDIHMPGSIDGLEATRIIKSDPLTRNCSIIILTGQELTADYKAGIIPPPDSYFSKPFSPLELIIKIQEILG